VVRIVELNRRGNASDADAARRFLSLTLQEWDALGYGDVATLILSELSLTQPCTPGERSPCGSA
jgi:hypothetical protein